MSNDNHKHDMDGHHDHHILADSTALKIGGSLLLLTIITVAAAHVNFGSPTVNFVIAMFIATVKALLVALFFMNLLFDRRENGVIFGTSFLFLAIFLVLSGTDLFFRGDVYVKGPLAPPVAQAKARFAKPWVPNEEVKAWGKELFAQNCVSCHGPSGEGNGPAAGALTPKPRNFTKNENWKNGRKPSQIFGTLNKGIPGSAMASFASLPFDQRWALAQFVSSLGPTKETDSEGDLKTAGVDPNAAGGGEKTKPSIPIEIAIDRIAVPE